MHGGHLHAICAPKWEFFVTQTWLSSATQQGASRASHLVAARIALPLARQRARAGANARQRSGPGNVRTGLSLRVLSLWASLQAMADRQDPLGTAALTAFVSCWRAGTGYQMQRASPLGLAQGFRVGTFLVGTFRVGGADGTRTRLETHDPAEIGSIAESEGAPPPAAEPAKSANVGSLPESPPPPLPEMDLVEVALADAIRAAAAAGQWGVVAQLARDLEARRDSRSAPNVVPIRRDRG